MPSYEQLHEAKTAAKRALENMPGVQGIGVGEGVLRVYVRDATVIERLPRSYEGVQIEFVITGDIKATD